MKIYQIYTNVQSKYKTTHYVACYCFNIDDFYEIDINNLYRDYHFYNDDAAGFRIL